MENVQAAIAAAIFIGVILLIITEWIHLTVAAFLGALILVFTHVMTLNEAIEYISRSHAALGLFFGVMVMVRAFEPTKVFDYLATQMVFLRKEKAKISCWVLWRLLRQFVQFYPMLRQSCC